MSKKFQVVALIPIGFMPREKLIFKTRFEKLARFIANFSANRKKYAGIPIQLKHPYEETDLNPKVEWIRPWATGDERKDLDPVDYIANLNNVIDIKRGPQEPLPKDLEQLINKTVETDTKKVVKSLEENEHLTSKTILTPEQFRLLQQSEKNQIVTKTDNKPKKIIY